MITLEEYKELLINTYVYEVDNSEDRKEKRREALIEVYGKEYLQKIIDDTNDFVKLILSSDTLERGYCNFEIENYNKKLKKRYI